MQSGVGHVAQRGVAVGAQLQGPAAAWPSPAAHGELSGVCGSDDYTARHAVLTQAAVTSAIGQHALHLGLWAKLTAMLTGTWTLECKAEQQCSVSDVCFPSWANLFPTMRFLLVQMQELLDLDPLPVSALDNAVFQSLYRFTHFNAIQTQACISAATQHTYVNLQPPGIVSAVPTAMHLESSTAAKAAVSHHQGLRHAAPADLAHTLSVTGLQQAD